ncbi:NADH-quinone oxidoreductase subunit NuoK [Pontibacter sp. 172403-2]|uniref:NADH-quinone oxidoreductase subunit NuoK n=1 Tax=Pontibacter rufus TaxID=2791028 RepID=UPI0018AF5DF0|nr:NADH-quinone oxidoreductase subunit NuoK [Pontibacter sp. 172403-2]MBF9255364.1 NADH-quinone oxidoreductase subunit NuoK [Pontibacter sp. 172403-2]
MMQIPLEHILILSAVLFSLGILAVITKRHAVVVLMGIELIFNAANLNLVAFSRHDPSLLQGQLFSLFVMVVAAAEAAVALAIVLRVYQYFRTANLNEIVSKENN